MAACRSAWRWTAVSFPIALPLPNNTSGRGHMATLVVRNLATLLYW